MASCLCVACSRFRLTANGGANTEAAVYIDGGFEYLYEWDGSSRDEEMNEIHVMDGRSRIARVQVYGSTYGGSTSDPVLYNLEDHLGNSSFTLDDSGGEWSQEEYFPFGECSFESYARKRYRFCGKERDGESGMYYYGARYFAPWSCRFVSVDPLAGKYPFYTPYQYAGNQPIISKDLDGLEGDNKKYNVSTSDLLQWNEFDKTDQIGEGQYIYVNQPDPWGNDDVMKVLGMFQGITSLTESAVENLGNAGKAAESFYSTYKQGYFIMTMANGMKLQYKLGFIAGGRNRLTGAAVKAAKEAYLAEGKAAAKSLKLVTELKVAGVLFNSLGVALAVLNMAENGVNISNSLDLTFAAYAFVPGYGWVISGGYFLMDATIGKETFFLYWNEGMKGWEETRRMTGDGYRETLKSMGD